MTSNSLLDHMRWIAASAVCVTHARLALFPVAADAGELGPWGWLFYGATMFGPEAVIVFFVLSGYLVGGRLWTEMGEGRFNGRDYAIARTTRLYVPLIPAILLTLALGVGECGQSGLTILGNALLLQNVFVDPLCNNPALWSVSSEALFYILAPFAMAAMVSRRASGVVMCLAALLAMALLSPADARNLGFGAAAWMAGAAASHMPKTRLAIALPALVGALVLSRANILPHQLIGLSFVAVAAAAAVAASHAQAVAPRLGSAGAGVSYSLYLVHMPVIAFLAPAIGPLNHVRAADVALFAAVLIACAATALMLYWCAERHTRRVREWATANLHFRRPRTRSQSFR